MKNIVFICSANKDRSKTAEDYFSKQYPNIHFDSAGTNKTICNQLRTNYVNKLQLDGADMIFVMEHQHANQIKTVFGNNYFKKIKVLNIKDIYKYGSKDLIRILNDKILNL